MQVTILGSGAGGPFQGRFYTAQVVQVDHHSFLIDCGEGTQQQLYRYRVPSERFRQIFISHLHGDHVFGLIGLLTSYCLKRRSEKLDIFSPPGLREMVEQTARSCGILFPYAIEYHEVDASLNQLVFENKHVEVWSVPLYHRTACCGWLFREKPRVIRNIRKEKIEEYQIPVSQIPGIKAGADLSLPDGRVIGHEELTQAPKPPRSYAFCSDTAPHPQVVEAVKGVDLLYHEATFTDEHREEAAYAFHSTAAQAAEVARLAGVKKLLMGHFSGRYPNTDQHLAEARSVFAESYVVEEGGVYPVLSNGK